jgi:hypothetical protein
VVYDVLRCRILQNLPCPRARSSSHSLRLLQQGANGTYGFPGAPAHLLFKPWHFGGFSVQTRFPFFCKAGTQVYRPLLQQSLSSLQFSNGLTQRRSVLPRVVVR